jgi:hypothetical protein
MNTHITNTDTFKPDIVDHDIIVPNKLYFNIYNNSLDEPFHKFWFYIENAKLMNIYGENSIFRFALNNKNEKNKKIIDYLKKLFKYIQSLFIKTYPDITFEIPWKENDNYPYLMNLFVNTNTICMDSKQNSKNHVEITKDQSCSILFELTYIQLMKIVSGDNTSYSLKFKFSLIMVQEKIVDIKSSLLENINQINNPIQKPNFELKQNYNPIVNVLMDLSHGDKSKPVPIVTPVSRMSLNPNILLNKMMTLNKINKKDKDIKDIEEDKNIPEYLEQKNKLKKVETEEKSLIPILKKEFEGISLQKQDYSSDIIINDSYKLDEFKELDELDELEKLDIQHENLSNKSVTNINNKKINSKIIKKKIEKSDLELELELELEMELEMELKNIARK